MRVGATGTLPGMADAARTSRPVQAPDGGEAVAAPLCVLSVHAHPDDEASKGAATMARYAAEGVRTVLVTCTGGEAGDILNEEADSPEAREPTSGRCACVSSTTAVGIIGYDALHLLGYRDSGMPDTDANAHPENFANADLDEAVGRLVAIIRDRASAGDRDVLRRAGRGLRAPRPHPGARHQRAGVRPRRRIPTGIPKRASRGSR